MKPSPTWPTRSAIYPVREIADEEASTRHREDGRRGTHCVDSHSAEYRRRTRYALPERRLHKLARHRLMPHRTESALLGRSFPALVGWPLKLPGLATVRQGVIRVMRKPASSVAVITPLVFAGAVGAAAPRFPGATPALPDTDITPVAAIAPLAGDPPGPAVVAVEHLSTSLHIAAATISAPPTPLVVKSPGTLGIPSMALSAYRNAEQKTAQADPACGISWNLLAGIGRIESMHANGGATDVRGTAVRPIYGPALDGTPPGNEVIVQGSAGGRITYARAMGPMQFLPGTWARYAADGNGDGVADSQNLYDSTLGAARYLCSGGLNLRDPAQVTAAILRYNNSVAYAQNVLGWAAAYATGVAPVDLPPLTGPPPPLGDKHLENPEGLGPGLPLNIYGLPSTDPMAQMPLIDLQQVPGG